MPLLEISVDSLESALAAEQGGAQRVELCSALREGGLTPSLGLLRAVRAKLSIDVYVLIRPRSGDFLYTDAEFEIMREDIHIAAQAGADGVVLGLLTADGDVDVPRTQALVEEAAPMQVTFHRAFDMARDLPAALESVIACGADRVLTSGGSPSAWAGRESLHHLVQRAEERITLLVGGGVRPNNIGELLQFTGATEFHSSMRRTRPSQMRYRAAHLSLGEPGIDEYTLSGVRAEEVRELVLAARAVGNPVST